MNNFDDKVNGINGQGGDVPLSADDPRLTALALGELEDAALLARVEADPALKAEYERINAMAGALKGAYGEETASLAPARSGAHHSRTVPFIPANSALRVWLPIGSAIAACLVMALVIPALTRPEREPPLIQMREAGPEPVDIVPPLEAKPEEALPLVPSQTHAELRQPEPSAVIADSVPVQKTDEVEMSPFEVEVTEDLDYHSAESLVGTRISADLMKYLASEGYVANIEQASDAEVAEDGENYALPQFRASQEGSAGSLTPNTLAETRLNSGLVDIANANGIVSQQFLQDVSVTSSDQLLVYITNTEVAAAAVPATAVVDDSSLPPLEVVAPPREGYASVNVVAGTKYGQASVATRGLRDNIGPSSAIATSNAPSSSRQVPAAIGGNRNATSSDDVVYLSPFGSTTESTTRAVRKASKGKVVVVDKRASARDYCLIYEENPPVPEPSREAYDTITENAFATPLVEPLSTFSIDVDTASYSNIRDLLSYGQRPPAGSVRIEEMINYFNYDYAPPADKSAPFAAHLEATNAPWEKKHQLVSIGLKGYEIPWSERPASNLVFLVDVSGSMSAANKLPLVQKALRMLVSRLDGRDSVAIVTYAGRESLALPGTTANNRETISHAIDSLSSGGSTNGEGGIRMAYKQARQHFIKGGVNRVILCTDGDFNVGVTSRSELTDLIQQEAKSGVFLTICGFGRGNYQDATMEELSNKGNGNYAYIDSEAEARRVFIQGVSGNMITIAKDVKIQVEFNPAHVQAYRLIGYENRTLAAQDFNDDRKDAGEIGAGHTVTALYEVVPVGVDWTQPGVDALKYQQPAEKAKAADRAASDELLTVKIRYKQPDGDTSTKQEFSLKRDAARPFAKASNDTRWASAVALFGMLLRGSEHAGQGSYAMVLDIAEAALGDKPDAERTQFMGMVRKVETLSKQGGE